MPTSPTVTVLAHARVASPANVRASERGLRRDEVRSSTLVDALATTWPTDAHLTAYEPISVPVVNGAPGETMTVRHTRTAIQEGIAARLNVLIGDVDGPGHVATPEWRVETEARLEASGLAWYRTRNGYRVLEALPSAYVIESARDEELWWEFYLGWRETVQERFQIEIDERCKDWTRLYRLPNVVRDGQPQRSRVARLESIPTFDLDVWHAPIVTSSTRPSAPRAPGEAAPDAIERAIAIAERMPASIEGLRGDESLFRCARELAVELGEDAVAIHAILASVFNPRCLPAWDDAKLEYEATRAAAAHATPEDRSQRRRDELRAAQKPSNDNFRVAQPREPEPSPWDSPLSFLVPEEPIQYLCEGLRLAPARGKISIIGGDPGGGKGPIANHLAVCLALGLPAFGKHTCRQTNVLLIDCEGARLTMRRLRRLARGMGVDPGALEGRLVVLDGSLLGDLTSEDAQAPLERVISERQIGAVILDSYTTAMLPTGIDSNAPQYAILAQLLGKLDVCVLAVAHRRKSQGSDAPKLGDIAGTGALGALAQTAIVVHYPDETNRNVIRVGCARAPETGFASFDVEFSDAENDALSVTIRDEAATNASDETPVGIVEMKRRLEAASRDAD